MQQWPRIERDNNFDLVRLVAAFQVAFQHAVVHLGAPVPHSVMTFIGHFPGVPIFFFISGLLVTSSLVRRPLAEYAASRARRVFPALWLAFVLAVIMLVGFGQIGGKELADPVLWIWAFTQTTLFQVFNPDMFRDFGVGTVNGSLWTIPVEIGFYMMLPVIFWLSMRNRRMLTVLLVVGAVASYAVYVVTRGVEEPLALKILGVTTFPYLWLFALGSLAYIYLDPLLARLSVLRRAPLGWAIPLVAYILYFGTIGPMVPGWIDTALGSVLLVATVLSLALIAPSKAAMLKGNDISYGLYLYHMLAVNAALALGFLGFGAVAVTLTVSVAVAWVSWRYLESGILHRAKMRTVALELGL